MTSSSVQKSTLSPDASSRLWLYDTLATGIVPEWMIRIGIRQMLATKLRELDCDDPEARTEKFAEELKHYPIAVSTDAANIQHYEVPTEFFRLILGPYMKYSCCLWDGVSNLAAAERQMIELTCRRAELSNGQEVLDLGCGWGSFSLYAAQKFPGSAFTMVSNSQTQREFINMRARELGLQNIKVITCDINNLSLPGGKFDRVVSVEMFEHAKNYQLLLQRISSWLNDNGKLFVHIFSHTTHQYHYGMDDDDWLARYFFTGGTMPSDKLLLQFNDHMQVATHWTVKGTEYQKTAEAWLKNMEANRSKILEIIATTYGAEQQTRWWVYWRLFFLSCAELWGFKRGTEWIVSHYLFEKRKHQAS